MRTNLLLIGILLSLISNLANAETYRFTSHFLAAGNPMLPYQPAVLRGEFVTNKNEISQISNFSIQFSQVGTQLKEYHWVPNLIPNRHSSINYYKDSQHIDKTVIEIDTTTFLDEKAIENTALFNLVDPEKSLTGSRTPNWITFSFICPKLPSGLEIIDCVVGATSGIESHGRDFPTARPFSLQSLTSGTNQSNPHSRPSVQIQLKY